MVKMKRKPNTDIFLKTEQCVSYHMCSPQTLANLGTFLISPGCTFYCSPRSQMGTPAADWREKDNDFGGCFSLLPPYQTVPSLSSLPKTQLELAVVSLRGPSNHPNGPKTPTLVHVFSSTAQPLKLATDLLLQASLWHLFAVTTGPLWTSML